MIEQRPSGAAITVSGPLNNTTQPARLAAARVDEASVELGGGVRAWWAGHAAPRGASGTMMRCLGGGRAVLVWDAPGAEAGAGRGDGCVC